MPTVIQPKPEFEALTEAEIDKALADPDPANPIAIELARLITGYSENLRAHVERLGYFPRSILHMKPRTAIEATAMRLTTEAIRAELETTR